MLSNACSPDIILATLVDSTEASLIWSVRLLQSSADTLRALLRHASLTVPFYRDRTFSRQHRGFYHLADFPLVTRRDIAGNPSFLSAAFQENSLVWHMTSGTTGVPIRIARDRGSLYAANCDFLRPVAAFVPAFGACLRPGQTAAVVVDDLPSREPYTYINPSIKHALVHRVILGRNPLSDRQVVDDLRAASIPLLVGRPRALLRLAELDSDLNQSMGRIRPSSILTAGDNLYKDERLRLEKWFEARVHNAYSSQEAGIIAVECEHAMGMHIITDRLVIELLGTDGVLYSEGEGQLVVTAFENWAMPFIRYVTDDQVSIRNQSCDCGHNGPTIISISGRDSPYFAFGNQQFNPSLLAPIFDDLPVSQYRVIQGPALGLRVEWLPAGVSLDIPAVTDLIATRIKSIVGRDDVYVIDVSAIGLPGQKVQRFVRELRKERG